MPKKFYKFKLLLDENMPPRFKFTRLNSRYDLKHIRDDFHLTGLSDPKVYDLACQQQRLILTFNGTDFRALATKSHETGIIALSRNLLDEQIDTKLGALLSRSTPASLFGKYMPLTGEM